MSTLLLTLSKLPFDVMVTGEKDKECRKNKPSKTGKSWMSSRLYDKKGKVKHYDFVHFINGYGGAKPFFVAEYKGFTTATKSETITYKNGLVVEVEIGDFIIELGEVTEFGNLKKSF